MAEIIVSNKMSSTYNLVAQRTSTIDIEVISGKYEYSYVDVDVAVRGSGMSEKDVELTVVYAGNSEILVDIQPKIVNQIDVEVFVNPHNKMTAIYELMSPPTEELVESPIKDTFTSTNQPYNVINFGNNNSMKVGNDSYGNNTSFIQFDISDVPNNVIIKSATMRLYYTQYNGQELDLYRVIGSWGEYSLTNDNMNMTLNPLPSTLSVNTEELYIEFDVTDITTDWYKGLVNNGLAIKSDDSVAIFRTREYLTPPELIIVYYSDLPYSVRTSKVPVEVEVVQSATSNINVEVDVISHIMTSDVLVSVYAHHPDIPIYKFVDVDVEVPSYDSESSIDVEVRVVDSAFSTIDVNVIVPSYEDNSSIDVELIISNSDYSNIDVELEVLPKPKEEASSDILVEVTSVGKYVNTNSVIDVEVEIPSKSSDSIINVDVEVVGNVASKIDVEVIIPSYNSDSEVLVEVDVPVKDGDSEVYVEIGVLGYGDSSVDVEFYPRVFDISQVNVEVIATKDTYKNIYVYMI